MNAREPFVFKWATLILSMLFLAAGLAVAGRPKEASSRPIDPSSADRIDPKASATDEVTSLKQQLEQQQARIEQLLHAVEQLTQRVEAIDHARALAEAPAAAPPKEAVQVATTSPVVPPGREKAVLGEPVPPRVTAAISGSATQAEEAKRGPLAIRIGDADLTLGGFMDFTSLFRSANVGSGLGTSFGAIPFSNVTQGRLTETRLTAQNSRISLKATSKVGKFDVIGYVEADFNGFQPANGFVTSNSNTLRMRLYWVDVRRGKFEVLGGQSWSMLTPNRRGLSPHPSDIFYAQNMDTNYQVGLTWTRAAQVRFIYHPTNAWAVGLALENPQQYVGTAVALPGPASATTSYTSQVETGSNAATPNLHPDIIAKIAYDPSVAGRHLHVEVAGLLRSFRIFNPITNRTATTTGGGGSLNANLELVKNFNLILNTYYSNGGGRYIFGLGPDLIVRPDGTPSPVHAGSGIVGFEYQFNPKTMLYGYYGGAYFQRNTAFDPATDKLVGFGYSGSSASANRAVQEGSFGFIQTFWKSPHYGALQLINQYSYVTRVPWWVAAGQPKNAHLSMVYVDLRYVLP